MDSECISTRADQYSSGCHTGEHHSCQLHFMWRWLYGFKIKSRKNRNDHIKRMEPSSSRNVTTMCLTDSCDYKYPWFHNKRTNQSRIIRTQTKSFTFQKNYVENWLNCFQQSNWISINSFQQDIVSGSQNLINCSVLLRFISSPSLMEIQLKKLLLFCFF